MESFKQPIQVHELHGLDAIKAQISNILKKLDEGKATRHKTIKRVEAVIRLDAKRQEIEKSKGGIFT